MRSLLEGITSAMRGPQMFIQQQQQQQQQQPSAVPTSAQAPPRYSPYVFATESSADAPFSVLLLTQNIGGIDPFASADLDGGSGEEDSNNNGNNNNNNNNSTTKGSPRGGPSSARAAGDVPQATRRELREFLTELRALLHELCRREAVTHRRPIAAASNDTDTFNTAAMHTNTNTTTSSTSSYYSSSSTYASASVAPPLVDVIVIHFQEIGGKRRHPAFNAFFAESIAAFLPEAGWTSGLLMETDPERFTAMGSIVFLSQRMCPITSMLSFRHRTFVAVPDDPRTYGSSPTFLFHGGKFAGASRKGFLLISLRFGTVAVNFLNVHLFHDRRNTTDAALLPPGLSCYAEQRQAALLEAIAECVAVIPPQEPLFVFGDFNTRLDAAGLLQYVKESLHMEVQLTAQDVQAPEGFWDLFLNTQQTDAARKFDVELQRMMDVVAQQSGVEFAELEVCFPPTYARLHSTANINNNNTNTTGDEEGNAAGEKAKTETPASLAQRLVATPTRGYARRRIPAWCDRIVWNPAALELMTGRRAASATDESSHRCAYQSFALAHTDHDGVALFFLGG